MGYRLKVILITTDTLHHRFLIKTLNKNNKIKLIIFFIKLKSENKNKFAILENTYEKKVFFNNKKFKFKNTTFCFDNVNSKKLKKKIKDLKPKLGILFGTKKVDTEVIKIFKKKLINIHRGIMEHYRGLDSEFWASYNQDFSNIGSTLHYVTSKLDMGKIILQEKLKLKKNMKSFQLKALTTMIISKKINKIINDIIMKKKSFKKKQKIGKYYSKIQNELKKIAIKNFDKFCKEHVQ